MAGIPVSIQPDSPYHSISVHKSPIRNFNFDATECPDLFPALTTLAARAEGTSTIKGIHRLLHKESDRATVLQEEFQKLGIQITTREDLMIVTGRTLSGNATLHSHQDHRVAMALATVALRAKGPPSTGRRIISKQIIPRLLGYTRSTQDEMIPVKTQEKREESLFSNFLPPFQMIQHSFTSPWHDDTLSSCSIPRG